MSRWSDFEFWDERREEPGWDAGDIRVRWGLAEDEVEITKLVELNGIPRWVAFEERFIVIEKRDETLSAALTYRMASKQLLLGLLVVDPWAEEGHLARALYRGAAALAQEAGISEVRARPNPHGNYPSDVGYRWRKGGWHVDTAPPYEVWGELPGDGWRRVLALLGIGAVPFFRGFRP